MHVKKERGDTGRSPLVEQTIYYQVTNVTFREAWLGTTISVWAFCNRFFFFRSTWRDFFFFFNDNTTDNNLERFLDHRERTVLWRYTHLAMAYRRESLTETQGYAKLRTASGRLLVLCFSLLQNAARCLLTRTEVLKFPSVMVDSQRRCPGSMWCSKIQ